MRRGLPIFLLLVAIGLMVPDVRAQAHKKDTGGGNESCPSGTFLLAKFENVNGSLVFVEGTEDEVSIDQTNKDSEDEIIGGDWSSLTRVGAIVVKGGTIADLITFSPVTAEGSFNNDGIEGKEISNLKFCVPEETQCDNPTLVGDDVVDTEARTVSNTVHDDEGIDEFTFTVLDNFTVVESSIPEDYNRSGNTWTWTGGTAPPTEVGFKLQAGPESRSTYFLEATDACPTPKTTHFDPIHDLGPGITQFRLVGASPNPLREWTAVEFAVPEQTDVRLTVYNVMGQKVATLVDGMERAGTHRLTWQGRADSGRQLASGVYILRLEAGDQISTRRLTIVR